MLRDPRLDPRLRPDQWNAVRRRARWRLTLMILLLVVAAGAGGYWWQMSDRSRDLSAEALSEAAGRAILEAASYHFTVDLVGEAEDHIFPQASMAGTYQRAPHVMHLKGKVLSGESNVELEYYLDQKDLYLKDPRNQNWLLLRDADLEELASFKPDNLAAPLITGLRSARVLGREELPGGPAVVLQLELDPNVMLPRAQGLHDDRTDYKLWLYTRTLKPARFVMQVSRPEAAGKDRFTLHFTYKLEWDFKRLTQPLEVPSEIRRFAREIGGPPEPLQWQPQEKPAAGEPAKP